MKFHPHTSRYQDAKRICATKTSSRGEKSQHCEQLHHYTHRLTTGDLQQQHAHRLSTHRTHQGGNHGKIKSWSGSIQAYFPRQKVPCWHENRVSSNSCDISTAYVTAVVPHLCSSNSLVCQFFYQHSMLLFLICPQSCNLIGHVIEKQLMSSSTLKNTDSLTEGLTDFMRDSQRDWLMKGQMNGHTDWLDDWLIHSFTCWLTDWRIFDRLAVQMIDWFTDWLTDLLTYLLTDWLANNCKWLIYWLTDWLIYLLTVWL